MKKGLIERIHIESCTRNAGLYMFPHVGTSARTSDAIYVWVARWYAFSRCKRTDGDCVRFRVDRRLIDMSQDRKNQRDQTQPPYTQVGPQLFHVPCSRGITLKIYCQVKSGCSVVLQCLICERYHSARIVIIKMDRDLAFITEIIVYANYIWKCIGFSTSW